MGRHDTGGPSASVGVDIEVEDNQIWCTGLAAEQGRAAYLGRVDVNGRGLWPCFHNGKYDLAYLDPDGSRYGTNFYDSMMEGHFLGYRPLNLSDLTSIFLTGTPLDKTVIKERKKVRFDERADTVLDVCSKDAWASHALHSLWRDKMAPYEALYQKERKITRILMSMERTGLPLSAPKVKQAMTLVMQKMGSAEVRLRAQGITEPGNKEAIGQRFWRGKKRILTTKTGQLSTTADHLREYASPDQKQWVEDLIEWRQMDKFRSTYLMNWLGQEWLYPDIKQWLATWRFSYSNPNLQNITKSKIIPLYQLFVAPEGWTFIDADYSQIELRVLANITRDPAMIQAYLSGSDLHQATILGTPKLAERWHAAGDDLVAQDAVRTDSKKVNFGIAYKITPFGLAPKIGESETLASGYITDWYNIYKEVGPWQDLQARLAREKGYVETMEGRPLWVPGIFADEGILAHHADKQTSNFPVQGGAAEILKNAMIRCPEYLVMTVHDSLVYLVPKSAAQEYYHFLEENLVDRSAEVQYTVDIKMADTWGDIKSIPDIFEDEEDD